MSHRCPNYISVGTSSGYPRDILGISSGYLWLMMADNIGRIQAEQEAEFLIAAYPMLNDEMKPFECPICNTHYVR
jgi:hypothetical protein